MISKKLIKFVQQKFVLKYGEWHVGKCSIDEVLLTIQIPMHLVEDSITRDLMRDTLSNATPDDLNRILNETDFTSRKNVLSVACLIGNVLQCKHLYTYTPDIHQWLERLHTSDGYFDMLDLVTGLGWTFHSIPFKIAYIISVPGGANVQEIG